jgi:hypothetical protein
MRWFDRPISLIHFSTVTSDGDNAPRGVVLCSKTL